MWENSDKILKFFEQNLKEFFKKLSKVSWKHFKKNSEKTKAFCRTEHAGHVELYHVDTINMFHVFALANLTISFLWSTLLFFHCYDASASMYTASLRMHGVVQVRSRLSFLKLFTDTRSEAGHETFPLPGCVTGIFCISFIITIAIFVRVTFNV